MHDKRQKYKKTKNVNISRFPCFGLENDLNFLRIKYLREFSTRFQTHFNSLILRTSILFSHYIVQIVQ